MVKWSEMNWHVTIYSLAYPTSYEYLCFSANYKCACLWSIAPDPTGGDSKYLVYVLY